MNDRQVDVAIIGAGSAGLFALSQVRRAGKRFVLIEDGPLGTTCARVGCMPSKALIHAADAMHQAWHGVESTALLGGQDGKSRAQALHKVRAVRDLLAARVIASSTAKLDEETFIRARARLLEPTIIEADGQIVRARATVLATGSRPVVPAPWFDLGERLLTTDTLFEQIDLPDRMAVVGLGVIGLEMGQALHRLGIEVTGLDQGDVLANLPDPVINSRARELFEAEFPLWLGEAARLEADGAGLRVTSGTRQIHVDKALIGIGRSPNLDALAEADFELSRDARGVPHHNPTTMQVGNWPLFIAGDVTGKRAVLHEAADEGRIAGYNAARVESPVAFRRKTPLTITFTAPNIATVGARLDDLDPAAIVIGEQDLASSGRALVMNENRGLLRVYAARETGRLLGAAMLGPRVEHLAHLVAWSLEQGLTVADLLRMPYYHPVIEEALQNALHDANRKLAGPREILPELAPLPRF